MPLIPILGPWIVRKLLGRVGERAAKAIGEAFTVIVVAGLLWLAISTAIGAIRSDARNDLLAEQAEQKRIADEAQRKREAAAQGARDAALAAGAVVDTAQQKDLTDATKDLADSRPSARQRARVCRELQQQDKASGRAARSC